MLVQILPAGASKGHGVDQLLKHLDIHPDRVLAMGDGENDKLMLQVRIVVVSWLHDQVFDAKFVMLDAIGLSNS